MRRSHSTQAQLTASHCRLTSPTGDWLFTDAQQGLLWLAAKFHQGHAAGSRGIQNGRILSGQPSHLPGKSLALCFAWLNERQVQCVDTYKNYKPPLSNQDRLKVQIIEMSPVNQGRVCKLLFAVTCNKFAVFNILNVMFLVPKLLTFRLSYMAVSYGFRRRILFLYLCEHIKRNQENR
jgi:hypothetical protein